MRKSWRHRLAGAGVAAALLVPATAQAAPNNNTSQKLTRAVTAEAIRDHNEALQAIADANDGNRVAGLPGHDESAEYVAEQAEAAGLDVSIQEFTYEYALGDISVPVLDVVGGKSYEPGLFGAFFSGEFGSQAFSPSGDVTAPLWAADLKLPSTGGSTSGCQAADYAGMPAGAVVLVQRGTCPLIDKWLIAQAAGAGAIIFFDEGNTPARSGVLYLNVDGVATVPTLTGPFSTLVDLAGGVTQGLVGKTVHVKVDWFFGDLTTRNVIGETPTGDPDNTIVVGAHLDSVPFGPGINDNGSGSGGILEIAEQLEKTKLRNQIRFMWFSAEESGLLGSEYYVEHLSAAARADIAAMLNFDMIASPNFVRFVYDGDLSDTVDPGEEDLAPAARPGSAAIEDVFLDYFDARGLATEPTDFDGRSDYGPFIAAGIPAGGLFTGAEEVKTAEQAAIYGGAAGVAFDPCYHAACDTLGNLNMTALEQMADGAAHATLTLAMNTEAVNGRRGKGNFRPDSPAPDALPVAAGTR
jgi:Zn-dependent M28 family amino/carboxypeptidase